jgi:DNA-binding MarR family transcriptional regulator
MTTMWLLAATLCPPALALQPDPMAPAAASAKPVNAKPAGKANAPASPDDQALAGPKVDKPSGEKSIIERNFDGSLARLEVRPEQATVDLLTLTPEQKQAVAGLFERRAKEVSKILYDHFDTFLAVQAARQGGAMRRPDNKERDELAVKMRELRDAADDAGLIRPPLEEQVAAALPEEQRAEFRRIVDEYMVAMEEQAQRDMGGYGQGAFTRPGNPTADGPRRGPNVRERAEMNLLLREVARTLGAQVQERKEQTEALLKAVEATPEQAAKIQAILREAGEKNRGRPSPEQRAEVFRKILDVLTPEQRDLARERLRGR